MLNQSNPTALAALLVAAGFTTAGDGLPVGADLQRVLEDALRETLVGPMTEAIQRAALPRYLTVNEAAEVARCSRRTVDYWRQRRRLAFTKIGGRVVIASADLLHLLDEQGRVPALSADKKGAA
jgi:excisionase family DNA binding protein